MAAVPPPQGMSETDYDAIEAAVTETVRGRWFLQEFARRNRLAETNQLLESMARLEAAVLGNQAALPSADPSIRLLIQRIKEIAGYLGAIASDMRAEGLDDRYVAAIDSQSRAVASMLRGATPVRPALPSEDAVVTSTEPPAPPVTRMPRAELASAMATARAKQREAQPEQSAGPSPASRGPMTNDPRLAALSRFDGMTLGEKLSLFT